MWLSWQVWGLKKCQKPVPISCGLVCPNPLFLIFPWVTTPFPSWKLTSVQHPVASWMVSAPQTFLQDSKERNKDLADIKYVSVPTHCQSSLTGILQNKKKMGKHLILLLYFWSLTRTLIRYTSQINSNKEKVCIPQTSLRVLLLIQKGLGIDTLWLSLVFVKKQLWITYSHWWWCWVSWV